MAFAYIKKKENNFGKSKTEDYQQYPFCPFPNIRQSLFMSLTSIHTTESLERGLNSRVTGRNPPTPCHYPVPHNWQCDLENIVQKKNRKCW